VCLSLIARVAVIALLCLTALLSNTCTAISPEEVLVIANTSNPSSLSLATYYVRKRNIPSENILLIRTTGTEACTRKTYEETIAQPVRRFLTAQIPVNHIRCLALMYGIPLKILLDKIDSPNRGASVDSEISLVLAEEYPLAGWIPNPFFVGFKGEKTEIEKDMVLMVSRLDGPSEATVKRIIDDSIRVESKGLKGTAYFDARWPEPNPRAKSGYTLYDQSIHLAAKRVRENGRLPVVLDDKETLFTPGACPDASLYCGWYSLAEYVDAFQWNPGAVGYHIASGECATLKENSSRVWCKRMLEEGVAATLGPVAEPYVNAFPLPEIFFSFLVDGYLTLAECYMVSLPYLSWQMVLVGDPLYRPFQAYLRQKVTGKSETQQNSCPAN